MDNFHISFIVDNFHTFYCEQLSYLLLWITFVPFTVDDQSKAKPSVGCCEKDWTIFLDLGSWFAAASGMSTAINCVVKSYTYTVPFSDHVAARTILLTAETFSLKKKKKLNHNTVFKNNNIDLKQTMSFILRLHVHNVYIFFLKNML